MTPGVGRLELHAQDTNFRAGGLHKRHHTAGGGPPMQALEPRPPRTAPARLLFEPAVYRPGLGHGTHRRHSSFPRKARAGEHAKRAAFRELRAPRLRQRSWWRETTTVFHIKIRAGKLDRKAGRRFIGGYRVYMCQLGCAPLSEPSVWESHQPQNPIRGVYVCERASKHPLALALAPLALFVLVHLLLRSEGPG